MITLKTAHTIALQLGLDRPSSRYTIRRIARAHGIIRRHTDLIAPIEFDGEIYRIPSQQWSTNKQEYKVRILKGFPSCTCADWQQTAMYFHRLPIVPYVCKHGLAVMLMRDMGITIERSIIAIQSIPNLVHKIKPIWSHHLAESPEEACYLLWCEQRNLGGY